MSLSVIARSSRLPFLILTPICVFLGAAVVVAQGQALSAVPLILALLGGLLAHISVNTLNEYLDFSSGLDLATRRTPFSGGSGALPEHPEQSRTVLWVGIISLLLTAAIGAYFVWLHGLALMPLGVAGLLLIVFYTRWINRLPWLCLIAPGLGFGVLMVVGTQFVLTGDYRWPSLLIGLIPFLLVNNLLLLNQYPDVEADAANGRRHFPIVYGAVISTRAYGVMWLQTLCLVLLLVLADILPNWSLLALLPLSLGAGAWWGAGRYGFAIGEHPQWMALNVMTTLLTPLILAVTLVLCG